MIRLILEDGSTEEARIWVIDQKIANEIAGLATGLYGEAKIGEVIASVIE